MNKLKDQLNKEISSILSRYNCCIDILNGMSELKAKKIHNVGVPKKVLQRWCEAANRDEYHKLDYNLINSLRENKHLFIGEDDA